MDANAADMDRPALVKTSINLPSDLLDWLKVHAEEQERNVSSQIVFVLRQYKAKVEQGDRS